MLARFKPSQLFRQMSFPSSLPETGSLLSRAQLALRWSCSIETLKRREKSGGLSRILIGPRLIRYSMAEVLKIEGQKGGSAR